MSLNEEIAICSGDMTPGSSVGEPAPASLSGASVSDPPRAHRALLTHRFSWGARDAEGAVLARAVAEHVANEGTVARASKTVALSAVPCRVVHIMLLAVEADTNLGRRIVGLRYHATT